VPLGKAGKPSFKTLRVDLDPAPAARRWPAHHCSTVAGAAPASAGIPVVAVTAQAMAGDRDRAIEAGFDHYLTMPINPRTFAIDIDSWLPV